MRKTNRSEEVEKPEHQPEPELASEPETQATSNWRRWDWKKLRLPQSRSEWLFVLAGLGVLATFLVAWPSTRYSLFGGLVHRPVVIKVENGKTHKPVSQVTVRLGSKEAKTDANGMVTFAKMPAGNYEVAASKKYYDRQTAPVHVPFFRNPGVTTVSLAAIGNQVSIKVVNGVTGRPLAQATISVLGATATSDDSGAATVVLPANGKPQTGTAKLAGYNDRDITITNSESVTEANTFKLTPAGKVYFLSKRTGVISVMRSDLDGSNATVVLAGTGREDEAGTYLMATQDWRYLALQSAREAANKPKLYLIDTANGQLRLVDQGDAGFSLIGWSGHYLVYSVSRPSTEPWRPGNVSIKSYDADQGRLRTLVSNDANGSNANDARTESIYDRVLMGNVLVVNKTWSNSGYYWATSLAGLNNAISVIKVDGSGSTNVKTADAAQSSFNNLVQIKPLQVSFGQSPRVDSSSQRSWFLLNANGTVTPSSADLTPNYANMRYYYPSPDSQATLWSESRDGKNTLFMGGANAEQPKTLATMSEFTPYGWFGKDYILLSKQGSELYIAPADMSTPPVKVTDYHKPNNYPYGGGGGYGG